MDKEKADCECNEAKCFVTQGGKARDKFEPSSPLPTFVTGGLDTCSTHLMQVKISNFLDNTRREI